VGVPPRAGPALLTRITLADDDEFRMNLGLRGVSRAATEGLNEGSHHARASLAVPWGVTLGLLFLT
jgi:hypothetical protein